MQNWSIPALIATHLAAALVGAAAAYYGEKYTDRRRSREAEAKAQQRFEKMKATMPALFAEMREDVRTDQRFTREFIPAEKSLIGILPPEPQFVYCPLKHQGLLGQVRILENNGFVEDVATGTLPRFRMTEDFVERLLR